MVQIRKFVPGDFTDTDKYINALHQYITEDKQPEFVVYADYDVDGVTSGIVTGAALQIIGAENVKIIYPSMKTGFGLNQTVINKFYESIPQGQQVVLLTADNGIGLSDEAIQLPLNWHLLVTDHHEGSDTDFPTMADAVVDPHRHDKPEQSRFDGYAGAGVIWKVMLAYTDKYGDESQYQRVENLVPLVALGTVCDQMQIIDENKHIVDTGLDYWNDQALLAKLIDAANQRDKQSDLKIKSIETRALQFIHDYVNYDPWCHHVTTDTFGWSIGPLINSSRRMTEESKLAYELFLSRTQAEQAEAYQKLNDLNQQRKTLSRQAAAEIISEFASLPADRDQLIVGITKAPLGICGLIASKVVTEFHCPAIIITADQTSNHFGAGSARSVDGVDILGVVQKLDKAQPGIVSRYGGHKAACGLSAKGSTLSELQETANKMMELGSAIIKRDYAVTAKSNNMRPASIDRTFDSWDDLTAAKLEDFKRGRSHQLEIANVPVKTVKQILDASSASGDHAGIFIDGSKHLQKFELSDRANAQLDQSQADNVTLIGYISRPVKVHLTKVTLKIEQVKS